MQLGQLIPTNRLTAAAYQRAQEAAQKPEPVRLGDDISADQLLFTQIRAGPGLPAQPAHDSEQNHRCHGVAMKQCRWQKHPDNQSIKYAR